MNDTNGKIGAHNFNWRNSPYNKADNIQKLYQFNKNLSAQENSLSDNQVSQSYYEEERKKGSVNHFGSGENPYGNTQFMKAFTDRKMTSINGICQMQAIGIPEENMESSGMSEQGETTNVTQGYPWMSTIPVTTAVPMQTTTQPTQTPAGRMPTTTQPTQTPMGRMPTATQPTQTPAGRMPTTTQPSQLPTGRMPTATQPTQTPAGRIPTTTQPTQTLMGRMPTATQPTQTPMGGMPTVTQPTQTPMGGMPTATQPTQTPAGRMPAAEQPSQVPMGGMPATTQPSQIPMGGMPTAAQPPQVPARGMPEAPSPAEGTVPPEYTETNQDLFMRYYNYYNNRGEECTGGIYVIKQGDTLYKLGKIYGVSVDALMRANPYVNVYNLQVGDEICIPGMPQSE